ncbi:MAG: tetratricopeptide repeat protein [Candidatus Kapaibacterium sp.]
MSHSTDEEARRYFQQAYTLQMKGNLDAAIDLYRKSIELHPTAEAHTFLGWSYSHKGDLRKAIEQCKIAIDLDPDFGNPYNDIGAYLIRLGKFEEAVEWLQQACSAPRYDARHYPHFNLGRAYERLGDVRDAIREYRYAATLEPGYKQALQAAERLQASMN